MFFASSKLTKDFRDDEETLKSLVGKFSDSFVILQFELKVNKVFRLSTFAYAISGRRRSHVSPCLRNN